MTDYSSLAAEADQEFLQTYLAYAQRYAGQKTGAAYDALEAEHAILMAAMQQAYDQQQWAMVRDLMWALHDYLDIRGYWIELRLRLEQAIHAAEQLAEEYNANAFKGNLAALLKDTGQLESARQIYEQVLAMLRKTNNSEGEAIILHQLGYVAQDMADYPAARDYFQQSLAIKEQLGNRAGMANSSHHLGMVAKRTHDYAAARRHYQQALTIFEELGNRTSLAQTLGELAIISEYEGDLAKAERMYLQALSIHKDIGNVLNISTWSFNVALLYEQQGKLAEALPLWEQCVAGYEQLGSPPPWTARAQENLARVRGALATGMMSVERGASWSTLTGPSQLKMGDVIVDLPAIGDAPLGESKWRKAARERAKKEQAAQGWGSRLWRWLVGGGE